MANLTPERKNEMAGLCSYFWVTIFSLVAFVCGLTAIGYCSFVKREIVFTPGSTAQALCAAASIPEDQCNAITQNHGVGFFGWQTTVPENQLVCMSYTQYIPAANAYITPWFDTNFQMAEASSFIANIFGGVAFFVMCLSVCCPISQARVKVLSCAFFIACLFQGFTLLIFQSNVCKKDFFASYFPEVDTDTSPVESVKCSLDTGSNLAVSATVFYFICIFAVFKAVLPEPVRMGGDWDDDLRDVEQPAKEAEPEPEPEAPEEQPVAPKSDDAHES